MGHRLRIAASCAWGACTVALAALAVALYCTAGSGTAMSQDRSYPPAGFFAGDYVVVGRHPGPGAAYAGAARIEAQGDDAMIIERTIDGVVTRAAARFRNLAPLMDAVVLDIHGPDGTIDGSCLWTVDLDNYPRLTCLRASESGTRDSLGHEALFPAH